MEPGSDKPSDALRPALWGAAVLLLLGLGYVLFGPRPPARPPEPPEPERIERPAEWAVPAGQPPRQSSLDLLRGTDMMQEKRRLPPAPAPAAAPKQRPAAQPRKRLQTTSGQVGSGWTWER